jgi:invasion protein IalB
VLAQHFKDFVMLFGIRDTRTAIGLASIALLGLSGAVGAQTAPPAQPAAPQITKTETSKVDNWLLTCVEFANPATKRACSAKSQIVQEKTNNVVFIWEIGPNNERKIISVMQVPTGVMIEAGLELRIGKAAPRKLAYTSCEPNRCSIVFPVDEKLVKEMAVSPKVEAVIKVVNGSILTFQIDATGIDKAYALLAK